MFYYLVLPSSYIVSAIFHSTEFLFIQVLGVRETTLWAECSLCILGEQRHADLGSPLARQSDPLESSLSNERTCIKKKKKVEK